MFNTLILPLLPRIKAWVVLSADRRSEVDDLFQEVLIEIYRNIDQAAAANDLIAWLYTLTRRKVNLLNHRHRDHETLWAEAPTTNFFEQLPETSNSSSLETSTSESSASSTHFHDPLFQRALSHLSPLQREVIIARSDGESQALIAKRLGTPRPTIARYEAEARTLLEEYLRPAYERKRRKARLRRQRREARR